VYATYKSFLLKVAFESDFHKKTFRCVIGFKEQLVICNEEDIDGRARVTADKERVLISIALDA